MPAKKSPKIKTVSLAKNGKLKPEKDLKLVEVELEDDDDAEPNAEELLAAEKELLAKRAKPPVKKHMKNDVEDFLNSLEETRTDFD